MKFSEYIIEARRTQAKEDNEKVDTLHALTGIVTECGKLLDCFKKELAYGKSMDVVNLKEEVGDLCWFLCLLIDSKQIDPSVVSESFGVHHFEGIGSPLDMGHMIIEAPFGCIAYVCQKASEALASELMGEPFGHTPMSRDLQIALAISISCKVHDFCLMLNISLPECLDINVAKLKKRYKGEGFTEEEALERDLESEREVLERGSFK